MKTNCVFMAYLVITVVLFAYPSLASKLEDDDEKPLIDPDVDIDSAFARSPTSDEYNKEVLPRTLPRDYIEHALVCGEMMGGERCNDQVMSEILQDKPASRFCCMKMIIFGEECHTAIRDVMFRTYQFKRYASVARPRIRQVWNRCYAEVGGIE
ncbi:hypothetical protein CARUB_v10016236mg [Capsella rubella]|uniref:Prolamin-like domain-containing protein n=1 Tax=Capsella rubella TaxID=81985 RepID=R0GBD7_9BRAS|nr:protein DOWN-REGULATED IN DIF1 11 [Capsella rubella]EOA32911.1 hypothetical protein CARUB_v10016236mg [Capsella rubella]